jgi:DNA mismatch repair ATPase MutS
LMYVKVFLLGELSAYLAAAEALRDKGEEIRELRIAVGALDAWCALAILAAEEGGPSPASCSEGRGRVDAKALRHPLVSGCVPNDLALSRGMVLTGTNMSGKSTFLRALGINQVLATGLGLAYAESFETDLFLAQSSIVSEDDRAAGKSRYLAEAERLLLIYSSIRSGGRPILALVDEVLNGTNSEDRIAASVAILRGAAGRGSILVAATHDREIARELRDDHDCGFFMERVEEGGLVFDYKLKEGIVEGKNALRILAMLGFDEALLDP